MKTRAYKSGMRWCVWRWTEVPSDYILRLHILKTPWFAVCLHWINGPDAEPHLHDHPVTFLSLVLRGGYVERRQQLMPHGGCGLRVIVDTYPCRYVWNFIRATPFDRHRIVSVQPGTLTICFMGPKRRDWGFHTPDGWVYWKDYNREKYARV